MNCSPLGGFLASHCIYFCRSTSLSCFLSSSVSCLDNSEHFYFTNTDSLFLQSSKSPSLYSRKFALSHRALPGCEILLSPKKTPRVSEFFLMLLRSGPVDKAPSKSNPSCIPLVPAGTCQLISKTPLLDSFSLHYWVQPVGSQISMLRLILLINLVVRRGCRGGFCWRHLLPCGREISKSSFITLKMLPLAREEWATLQALKVQESPQN